MAFGRVVRFDSMRGYGFIAPDNGGEDVFLHVNDLTIPEAYLRSGLAVEFEIEDGGRGLKASNIRLAQGEAPPSAPPATAAPSAPAASVSPPAASQGPEAARTADGDYPMCDVLSSEEYTRDVTELLLRAAPTLTADQILHLRHELVKFSEGHGWIEG